ncbi:MAG: response regulator [Vulcanimicrobiaceae bacterium]
MSTTAGSIEIVRDAAQQLLNRYGMAYARIWFFPAEAADDDVVGPAAVARAANAAEYTGGLSVDSIRRLHDAKNASCELLASVDADARFDGAFPGKAFIGLPLRSENGFGGYIEAYRGDPIDFALAAEIQRFAGELAGVLAVAQTSAPGNGATRGKILIAEDDPATRGLLRRILTTRHFQVIDVENGALACDAARREHPDLILIDWMMPVMDGRTATERLKSDPETRGIPVVMLTAQAQTDDKIIALEAGVQDFVTKPFDARELIARVEQQLRWRELLAADEPSDASDDDAPPASAGPPVGGGEDPWSKAVSAAQMGRPRDALGLYVAEAESCDAAKLYPRAAIAYRSASQVAAQLRKHDLSNKFLRLAGKMYLCWAESASDSRSIQEAYVSAARCFLAAGNLTLAKKSVDMANSLDAVMADNFPSALS